MSKEVIATNKLIDKKGMTLTELLAGIIVMLLVAGIMVIGIRLGSNAYVKSVSVSEAQELCSTITTLVNDELRYCGAIDVKDGEVSFFSDNFGKFDSENKLSFGQNEKGQVLLGTEKILAGTSYPHNLKAKVTLQYTQDFDGNSDVTNDNGWFDATVEVYRTEGTPLAQTTFQVQPLNHVLVTITNTN